MGNGMNKVLPGLYVGNFRDAKDLQQLADNKITHILAIHDRAKKIHANKEYLVIEASDNSEQELTQFFPECIDFIHKARLNDGNVLVHCLAGVSRSVTVTAAYIMTVTNMGWRDSLNCIRGVRNGANPNFGFQKQLQNYEHEGLQEARKNLQQKYPEIIYDDQKECHLNIEAFKKFVLYGSPTKEDGLYPLPYNAYKKNTSRQSQTEADDNHKTSSSGENLCSGVSDNASALPQQNNDNDISEKQTNRTKTVDFESLSDEIDDAYAHLHDKKVQ